MLDFGAHLYPKPVFPEPIAVSPLADRLGSLLYDPDDLETRFSAAGVDEVVLSQPFYMGSSDVNAVRTANDALRDVLDNPSGRYGLAAIPTAAGGRTAAAEFERCLEDGYHGGAIETKSEGIEVTDPELEPVYDVAERWDAPLLVHPKLDESLHPDVLDDKYLLNAVFGREAALSESICKAIHEGTLDTHPDLNLVYHHLGGNIPAMFGRLNLQLEDGRWPGQEAVKAFGDFRAQFRDRIYLDTSGFFGYETPIRTALEESPASNILFATDYPFEIRSTEELDGALSAVKAVATPDDHTRIIKDNAASLLVNTD